WSPRSTNSTKEILKTNEKKLVRVNSCKSLQIKSIAATDCEKSLDFRTMVMKIRTRKMTFYPADYHHEEHHIDHHGGHHEPAHAHDPHHVTVHHDPHHVDVHHTTVHHEHGGHHGEHHDHGHQGHHH
ncbi:hypothetical protein OSTOST_02455, partial [Ostertagia ostertagi]